MYRIKILLSLYLFVFSLIATSCQSSEFGWKRLLSNSWKSSQLAIDPRMSKLIVLAPYQKMMVYYDSLIDLHPIEIPLNISQEILTPWLSDKMWVSTMEGNCLLYDIQTGEWINITQSQLGQNGFMDCSTAPNGDVLLLAYKTNVVWIYRDSTVVSKIVLPEGIVRVGQDYNQIVWALSESGQIYKYEKDGWLSIGKVTTNEKLKNRAYLLFIDEYKNIWVVMNDGVYKYSTVSRQSEFVQGYKGGEFVKNITSIDSETTWIVTNYGITIHNGESVSIPILPWDVDQISSAVFDKYTGNFFISTNDGVFFRDLK